jgi:hypothetical protein
MTPSASRFLIAACFTLGAVPALAQSNSANEGAAATPEGTYSAPMAPQDRRQAQRQANTDPFNMPQNRKAAAANRPDPAAAQNDDATGKDQAPSGADAPARPNPP